MLIEMGIFLVIFQMGNCWMRMEVLVDMRKMVYYWIRMEIVQAIMRTVKF